MKITITGIGYVGLSNPDAVMVIKSTVPVGYTEKVKAILRFFLSPLRIAAIRSKSYIYSNRKKQKSKLISAFPSPDKEGGDAL